MAWGTDITYIPTDEGWLYLAGVKDFGSKEIVGWAMGDRMTKELVRAALAKALAFRPPLPGWIHHSARGSQYCSHAYRRDGKSLGLPEAGTHPPPPIRHPR
jgi:putative transposase